jgi:hypothetical protein
MKLLERVLVEHSKIDGDHCINKLVAYANKSRRGPWQTKEYDGKVQELWVIIEEASRLQHDNILSTNVFTANMIE